MQPHPFLSTVAILSVVVPWVSGFTAPWQPRRVNVMASTPATWQTGTRGVAESLPRSGCPYRCGINSVPLGLRASSDDEMPTILSESDQLALGVAGSIAALITLYSEFILKTTGCGLPAGPLGLVGAAEGVSYLGIVSLVGYSLYSKIKTGSGLPAGPGGILGSAEGLAFLAALAGIVVLGFQIMDYGYVPNAVPMEGGMCS